VLRNALRVLVHSQHAVELVRAWYGDDAAAALRQVPFLPHPPPIAEPAAARRRLGLHAEDFVVCSFGSLFPTKLNHRLLEAWLASPLAADPRCRLVFVGSHEDNPYEARLARLLAGRPEAARIRVTGYADDAAYADWQAAADVAVQLRTGSRGESSGAIHESLARGLPVILNAHGAATEFPDEVVLRLPDAFTTEALAEALQRLRADAPARAALGARAAAYARTRHHPPLVARRYRELIEDAYATAPRAREQALLRSLAAIPLPPPGADDLAGVALAMAANRPRFGRPRILFDVSSLSRTEFVTGIERVTRAVLGELIQAPPDGWRIEPVRIEGDGYVYARDWTSRFLGIAPPAPDEPVEAAGGDLFLGLDWTADRVPGVVDWFRRQRRRGVRIVFMVHDILPVQRPALFPPAIAPMVLRWLDTLGEVADGLVCPSAAVMGEVADWLQAHPPARLRPLRLGYFHLGADFGGVEAEAAAPPALAAALAARPGFLMVGTVEPRKGHRQALYAMEALWAGGGDANLVIVGRAGWTSDDLIARLRGHPEQGRRLFWLETAPDALLELLYRRCSALLAASEAEGFGLPLIEAAQRGLPILARDIPVFLEVAGPHAAYFRAETAAALAGALRDWLARHARGEAPASAGMPRQSWRQSTAALLRVALRGEWQGVWPAEVVARAAPGHVAPGHIG
jgi:glycosyltransferase involved in cell wall biosynthesis